MTFFVRKSILVALMAVALVVPTWSGASLPNSALEYFPEYWPTRVALTEAVKVGGRSFPTGWEAILLRVEDESAFLDFGSHRAAVPLPKTNLPQQAQNLAEEKEGRSFPLFVESVVIRCLTVEPNGESRTDLREFRSIDFFVLAYTDVSRQADIDAIERLAEASQGWPKESAFGTMVIPTLDTFEDAVKVMRKHELFAPIMLGFLAEAYRAALEHNPAEDRPTLLLLDEGGGILARSNGDINQFFAEIPNVVAERQSNRSSYASQLENAIDLTK